VASCVKGYQALIKFIPEMPQWAWYTED